MHYLHHLIFDPLSAWEQFKAAVGMTIPIAAVMLALAYLKGKK